MTGPPRNPPMSLKIVHLLFVASATALVGLFGGWSLARGGAGWSAAGIGALGLAAGLAVYGVWFRAKIATVEEERRRRRRLLRAVPGIAALGALAGERGAWACSVCYGGAEGAMIDAAKLGVLLLFGLVLAVQVAIAIFFVRLHRRARAGGSESAPPRRRASGTSPRLAPGARTP
jgi:hypothetical protein